MLFLIISVVLLWVAVLFLAFLLLGTLRGFGVLGWKLEQMQAITPRRIGREGLILGSKAPDFTLPGPSKEVSLHDYAGRKVLLVFTQNGCGPCNGILPDLKRTHEKAEAQVLVVNEGEPGEKADNAFPVLKQEGWSVSKRYSVLATPFAFFIDEQGMIRGKGVINSRQQIHYVLSGVKVSAHDGQPDS
jgi:methylamine dehydrogenase accessory protein MauD